ncbi:hypothetical protein STAS_16100 [Striga asiatica]|uniref:Uncharacterized protein n=1 Tax=Striga asiatica TaxID=4170 RepID=A0A5A7Q2Y9_STRAF|nr:hypothetical protein STAS_16100 [Striga asiatica]
MLEDMFSSSFSNHHKRPSPPSPVKPRTQPSAVEQTSPVPILISVEPPSQIPATVGDPSTPPLPPCANDRRDPPTRDAAAEPLSTSSPSGQPSQATLSAVACQTENAALRRRANESCSNFNFRRASIANPSHGRRPFTASSATVCERPVRSTDERRSR